MVQSVEQFEQFQQFHPRDLFGRLSRLEFCDIEEEEDTSTSPISMEVGKKMEEYQETGKCED